MSKQRTAAEILNDLSEDDRRELCGFFGLVSDPLTRRIMAYLAADPK